MVQFHQVEQIDVCCIPFATVVGLQLEHNCCIFLGRQRLPRQTPRAPTDGNRPSIGFGVWANFAEFFFTDDRRAAGVA